MKFKEIFMKTYFPKSIKTISDSEILAKVNNYENIFRNLCIQYAKKLKKFLERDYIGIVFESENFLSKLFGSFRVDKALKSILVRNESNTISPKKIERMIKTIRSVRDNENYNYKKKLAFKRILDFLHRYLRFSNNFYRNGINTIFSQLHFKDPASEKLVPRSWLIENLRNVFPKIFEIPLNNIFLTFYLFGDLPIDNRDTKLIKFLKKDRRYRRPHLMNYFQ
ncbi:MAG: hypothetical protein GF317_15770 [Candidatus Lokiarchaeota archaeon]|nr:hypothetical protein [Candidatus Lokiarchaeota archaeon]